MQIEPTENVVNPSNARSYLSASYSGMHSDDVGVAPQNDTATATATSVQVMGSFGEGQLAIEGTNDGVNWSSLRDPTGITLAIRSPGIRGILESAMQIRPRVIGGDETTNLTVTFLFRRSG
jgi:hypothetical protein